MNVKLGRNDPCSCGSGKKFKKCCEAKLSRKTVGNAQVISSGSPAMASLFQRRVVPVNIARKTEEAPPSDPASEANPKQDT